MSLKNEQLENIPERKKKSGVRKWYKNQRNRKLRRIKTEEILNTKQYNGWEY